MVWTSSRANSAGSAGSLPASACVSTWSRQAPMRIDATTSGCAHSSMRPSSCSAPMYDDAVLKMATGPVSRSRRRSLKRAKTLRSPMSA